MTEACVLCSSHLAPIVAESPYWRLVLNRNQNLLGKCFWVLNRHAESVMLLTPTEWMELHEVVSRTTQVLSQAFSPDHFNYSFLQNQDRHIHLHVLPRYASTRQFGGLSFTDAGYPGHYEVGSPPRNLPNDQFAALVIKLRRLLTG
jgi:diadenosine tetraphosphate (Ap4A) HIT family hydrolase